MLLLLFLILSAFAAEPQLPVLTYEAPAAYPPEALAEGAGASVLLELTVSELGEVIDARVVEPVGQGFDASALLAARSFRFTPALSAEGVPVPAIIQYSLVFSADTAPPLSLEGVVVEAGVRESLSGIELRALGPDNITALAISDASGGFSFAGLTPGPWVIAAYGPAFQRITETVTVTRGQVGQLKLYLTRDARADAFASSEELVITSERVTSEITERRLTAEEVQYLPGTNGDVVKVVQNLPGVARAPLGIGQLIIRGTAPEDSRFFIDGSPIPLVFHFSGLTAVINSDSISEVAYLPGNYSVRYGRALGGLVDLRTSSELPERSRGYVSVDLYQSTAFIERKIGEKTALSVSGRRSYIDAVLTPILSNGTATVQAPRYYDAQVRLLHEDKRGADWDALFYLSDDSFRFIGAEEDITVSLADSFQRGRIRRQQSWGGGWQQETTLSVGPERREFEFTGDSEAYEERLSVALRSEFGRLLSPDTNLGMRAGVDILTGTEAYSYDVAGFGEREAEEAVVFQPALYAEASARLGKLTLIPGLRGDASLYSVDHSTYTLDPRFAARFLLADNTRLEGSVGRFSAPPSLRQVAPEGGNPDLNEGYALQSSLGLKQQITGNLRGEITGFYNDLNNLIVGREDRFQFFSGPPPVGPFDTGDYANDGTGRVYGIETLLRYDGPAAVGLLTATFSRSERQDRPDDPVELFTYDQPIIVNGLWSQTLPKNWRLGARLRYTSGNPYTPIVNSIYDQASRGFIPVYGERSSARLPPLFSLDLRIDRTITYRKWKMMAYLDIQNIVLIQSAEVIGWSYDFSELQPLTSNPPLPAFGVKGEW